MSYNQNQTSYEVDSFNEMRIALNSKSQFSTIHSFQNQLPSYENSQWLLRTIKSLCNGCNMPDKYKSIKEELVRRGFIQNSQDNDFSSYPNYEKSSEKENNKSIQMMTNRSPFPQVYSTLEVISENDLNTVLKIQNLIDKQIYALKILKVPVDEAPYAMHEIQCLAHLKSPRLIRYFSSWVEENPKSQFLSFYIQTEYFEGSYTLQNYIQSRRNCLDTNAKDCHKILYELATALYEIYQAKIVHRDIQPSNIILRDDLSIVVIGFSICSPIHRRKHCQSLTRPISTLNPKENLYDNNTISHKIAPFDVFCINAAETATTFSTRKLGSPLYASPQQLNGRKSSPSDDIYSFGIVMFEVLANIDGDRKRINAIRQLRNFGILPEKFKHELKEEGDLILKMTSHDPLKRPSIEQILQANLFQKWKREQV